MNDPITLTALEQRLAQPGGEAVRQELLARLGELQWHLRQQLAASVPREDYPTAAALGAAAEAARELLDTWPANPAPVEDAERDKNAPAA